MDPIIARLRLSYLLTEANFINKEKHELFKCLLGLNVRPQ